MSLFDLSDFNPTPEFRFVDSHASAMGTEVADVWEARRFSLPFSADEYKGFFGKGYLKEYHDLVKTRTQVLFHALSHEGGNRHGLFKWMDVVLATEDLHPAIVAQEMHVHLQWVRRYRLDALNSVFPDITDDAMKLFAEARLLELDDLLVETTENLDLLVQELKKHGAHAERSDVLSMLLDDLKGSWKNLALFCRQDEIVVDAIYAHKGPTKGLFHNLSFRSTHLRKHGAVQFGLILALGGILAVSQA